MKKIVIEYNQVSGMGHGVRQALAREVPQFKAKYPSVKIEIRHREWGGQFIAGFYKDGSDRCYAIDLFGASGIAHKMHRLVNQCNDLNTTFGPKHLYRERSSVQGPWNPWIWSAERDVDRVERPKWDRKLTEEEWQYYVNSYSSDMKRFEEDVQKAVDSQTKHHNEHTKEVQRRWEEHVKPFMQTDVEHNLTQIKKKAAANVRPPPVTFGEYNLFAMPDVGTLSRDAIYALRAREIKKEADWWAARREQLKPPK